MTTAESKIDLLLLEMKTIQANQLKLTTSVDALTSRSDNTDRIAADLGAEIKTLTSRIATLEAATASSSTAPPREEEERAHGHREELIHQGADLRLSTLDPTLVKGEHQFAKSNTIYTDLGDLGSRKPLHANLPYDSKDFKLPKIDFPKFSGDNPRV
ncbi:unnamed protein product [Urochloa humidicola]